MLKRVPPDFFFCGMLLILIIIFFGKNILSPEGNFIGGIDVKAYYYWNIGFTKEMLLSGELPLWNPFYYSGHPFIANPGNFVFYPVTLLFLIMPLPLAFTLSTIIHVYIAALGMFFLLKLATGSRYAGLASAIVFSLSGYFFWRIYLGHIEILYAAALIPWIFYFIEKSIISNLFIYMFASGAILGLQILAGDPMVSYFTCVFLTIYFFMRWFLHTRLLHYKNVMVAIRFYIIIPLIAFGISAIQILPTLEFTALSLRAANTYSFATFLSFDPIQLFHYISPYFTHPSLPLYPEFGCYTGILSIILAGIGGAFSNKKMYTIPLLVMLMISLTFMLGDNTPIYHLYYKYLPLLSSFRIPARCIVMFDFSLAILAGFGLQHIYESGLRGNQRLFSLMGLTLVGATIILATSRYVDYGTFEHLPTGAESLGFAALFTVLSLLVLITFHLIVNKQVVSGILISILYLDLYFVCSPLIQELNENEVVQGKYFERVFEHDQDFYRANIPSFGNAVIDNPIFGLPNRAMKFHYYGLNGHTPLVLKDYYDFIYFMANTPTYEQHTHSFVMELFSPEKVFSSKILGVKYAIAITPGEAHFVQAETVQPHAVLIRQIIFTKRMEDQLHILKQSNFDPQKTILLDESYREYVLPHNASLGSQDQDMVSVTDYSPNRIVLKSYSPSNTMLLLSELYYPGWKAYVDGNDVPILRADYLMRAVKLESGHHSIVLTYHPMLFYVGFGITILTLTILAGMFLMTKRSKFRARLAGS